jgi:hypothetical protein
VNTHAEYRRQLQPTRTTRPARSVPEAPATDEARHLGIHGDPSLSRSLSQLPGSSLTGATTATGRRIAWVRPTELHGYADRLIGRGIDLQAELTRRARRVPQTATRAATQAATRAATRVTTRSAGRSVRRPTPAPIRRGTSTAALTHEGIEL